MGAGGPEEQEKRAGPEGRVGPEERPVRHDGHTQRHPEEHGSQEAPPAIVRGVFYRGLDQSFKQTNRYIALAAPATDSPS